MDNLAQKKNIRRTTIILVAIALAFYAGFILMGVSNS